MENRTNYNPHKDTSYNCIKCGDRFHDGQTMDGQGELCAKCELSEMKRYTSFVAQQEPVESAEF